MCYDCIFIFACISLDADVEPAPKISLSLPVLSSYNLLPLAWQLIMGQIMFFLSDFKRFGSLITDYYYYLLNVSHFSPLLLLFWLAILPLMALKLPEFNLGFLHSKPSFNSILYLRFPCIGPHHSQIIWTSSIHFFFFFQIFYIFYNISILVQTYFIICSYTPSSIVTNRTMNLCQYFFFSISLV